MRVGARASHSTTWPAYGSREWAAVVGVGFGLGLIAVVGAAAPKPLGYLVLIAAAAPFLLVLGRNLRRLLLALVIFDIPFQWDVNFDYRESAAKLNSLGGFSLSLTTLALAGLYALWIADLLARRPGVPRPRLGASVALLAFLAFELISLLVARDRLLSAFELVLLAQLFLLFLYVSSTVRTRKQVRDIVVLLMISLLAESVLALVIYKVGHGFSVLGISSNERPGAGGGTRLGGTIGSPNGAAAYLGFLLVLAIAVAAAPVKRSLRRLALVAAAAATLAFILTFSRGGWLGFAAALLVLAFAARRRGYLNFGALAALASALVLVALPFHREISNRLSGNDQGAARSRVVLDRLAWHVISANPVLGVGANNFGVVMPDYAGPEFSGEWITTVHNKFLLVWAEGGLGALIAFGLFLGTIVRRGWQASKIGDRFLGSVALGLTAAVIAEAVHMNFDIFNGRPELEILMLAAGLLTAMHAMRRSEPEEVDVDDLTQGRDSRDLDGRRREPASSTEELPRTAGHRAAAERAPSLR